MSPLINTLQGLVSQINEVILELGSADKGALELDSPNSYKEIIQLLHATQERANAAEGQVIKLQRELAKETNQAKISSQELNRLAFRDPLTGLANANLLTEHIEKSIRALKPSQHLFALAVDLDRFASINQMLGHQRGDELLIRVSERLHGLANKINGVIGRTSEDEFSIILAVSAKEAEFQAIQLARAVQDCLKEPFMLQGQKISLTASLGGSFAASKEDSNRELLDQAETALSYAKKNGRNQFHLYTPNFKQYLYHEAALEFQLGFAIEGRELFIEYLPIVHATKHSSKTAKMQLIGVEALLRWHHRSEGVIYARDFIGSAERSGKIIAIGRQMFDTACRDLKRWLEADADIFLNFNLSGRELMEPDTAIQMAEIADKNGVPAQRITFEFSENCSEVDNEIVESMIVALGSKGFSVAIDHYGTGVSSLQWLSSVQFLKLSPSLLRKSKLMDKALLLAKGLNLTAIGVGVETIEQAQTLIKQGFSSLQGFYFSAPLSATDVMSLYKANPNWTI